MKLPPRRSLIVIIIFIFLCSSLFAVLFIRHKNINAPVISPLPQGSKVLASWQEKTTKEKIWRPQETPDHLNDKELIINAQSALSIDLTNNHILFAKNANQPLAIASLTKIMTALVAQELTPLSSELSVSQEATKDGEASMGLIPGEKLTLEELLYGLMMVSGNDAANVIAEDLGGRQQVFVALMNEKARLMGLDKTHFYNPHGLDEDSVPPNQSTAYELAILTRHTLDKFPKIAAIVKTHEITFSKNKYHQEYHLINVLGLEETYPGMIGVKPGNTPKAGYCLIGLAENEGRKVLAILLNTQNPKEEIRKLFDFSFVVH